jgi:cation:H+ antiporter
MLTSTLLILAGLLLLYFGGEFLVRGAGGLAIRLGLTPLVAGLTVVAFGTSTPELFASVNAALSGQGDIAVGNVIGSNTVNIGFILGLTALIFPVRGSAQVLRFDIPVMIIVSLLPLWVLHDRELSRAEGCVLFSLIVAYTCSVVRMAKRVPEQANIVAEYEDGVPKPAKSAYVEAGLVVMGLALLVVGSGWLINGAVQIAKAFNVSEALIGLTIVSIGTSTPELAASLVAAFRKQPDIALGNIVGSCIFNILAILGFTGIVRPISAPGIGMIDVAVMIVMSISMFPMIRSGGSLSRGEGASLLAGYGVYIYWLWPK